MGPRPRQLLLGFEAGSGRASESHGKGLRRRQRPGRRSRLRLPNGGVHDRNKPRRRSVPGKGAFPVSLDLRFLRFQISDLRFWSPRYNTAMRYLTAAMVILFTSLWLGGLITLALLVMAVFISLGLDRETAGRATSSMFVWLGKAQLVVAAVALIATFLAYLQRRGGIVVMLFVLQIVATLGAVAFNMYIVPKLEGLRIAGQSQSADFKSLHKQSESLMSVIIVILFGATLFVPAVCRALYAAPRKASSLAD